STSTSTTTIYLRRDKLRFHSKPTLPFLAVRCYASSSAFEFWIFPTFQFVCKRTCSLCPFPSTTTAASTVVTVPFHVPTTATTATTSATPTSQRCYCQHDLSSQVNQKKEVTPYRLLYSKVLEPENHL